MKQLSVKLKVTLWYCLAMIVISAVVLTAMRSIGENAFRRNVEDRLRYTVTDLSRKISFPGGGLRAMPPFEFYEQGVHMALYDENGELIGGQMPFAITASEFKDDQTHTQSLEGETYYIYDRELRLRNSGSVWLRGVISMSGESFAMRSVTTTNLIVTLILIVIAAGGGYLIISRAFVPVNKIRQTAKAISESRDLSQRINIGTGRDEISQLAHTFDEMLEKIEQTLEREKQFTSDASHELRTPVSVILSECEYMEDCAKTAEEYQESAASVKKQAEKMSKLISELLMIARMDKKTMQLDFESVDISELVGFVCDEQEEIHAADITLVRNIEPGITALADRFLITRACINLLANAYQYSHENGTIKVQLAWQEGMVVFSVTDNGIGIGAEHLDKIWERFYQADPARTAKESGSMGLGLAMVKHIAECHGGSVSVASEPGRGSVFTFAFPKQ